jgi:ribosomal protein L11 methyltransferase
MNYIAYHFVVEPSQPGSDILIAMIADMGFESFDQNETGFTAYISEEQLQNVDLLSLQFEDFTFTYSSEKIEQANWNEQWEKNFEPVLVDALLCIRAPFHEPHPGVLREIVIMPKMSFGTGHHQTTRLMCRIMFKRDLKNKRVLDMGCGTGVLAILAKMLGSSAVVAVDIDDWSIENAKENCAANGCSDIKVKKGDADILVKEDSFDIILANINKNVLKSHMTVYASKLKPGGELFLSGFFQADVAEIRSEAEICGLVYVSGTHEDEWATIACVKP